MKLVATPCGKSVWVSEGLAEMAIAARGMDALKRLPDGWTMEIYNNRLRYLNPSTSVNQYDPPR